EGSRGLRSSILLCRALLRKGVGGGSGGFPPARGGCVRGSGDEPPQADADQPLAAKKFVSHAVKRCPNPSPRRAFRSQAPLLVPLKLDEDCLPKPHTGLMPQMSRAYSLMVRSLENLPVRATLRIAFAVHPGMLRYSSDTASCAVRYDSRSA